MNNSLLQLENIKKDYPMGDGSTYRALSDISLKINKGDFIAIMGPSGSGKSTLMHILGALDTPTAGKYTLEGKDVSNYTDDELARVRNQDIGFIFQAFNLLPRMTVYKNVEKPLIYGKVPSDEREERIMEALESVKIADKAQNFSNHISGGQIQRVAIARALVMDPAIILADEPTGNLDSKTAHEIMNIFKNMNERGRTIAIITHEDDIAAFAKRTVKLVDGKIVSDK